jgi:hypothetical protein
MATFSKKGEEEEQQQGKNGYWRNELYSLGVLEPKRKKKEEEEVKDNKAELENLADIIKRSMFEDYKLAYSEEGVTHKEEAEPTVIFDNYIKKSIYIFVVLGFISLFSCIPLNPNRSTVSWVVQLGQIFL